MDFSNVIMSDITVEQFVQLIVSINVFTFFMSFASFFLLYQLYQLLKFVFSCVSSVIKRHYQKSNN